MTYPPPFLDSLRSSIGLKGLMALSGGGMSLFLAVHLLGVSHLFQGRSAFLDYAARLHDLGLILPLLEAGLVVIFLVHVAVGLVLFRDRLTARPTPYRVKRQAGGSTWGSRTMPYSGLVILLFLIQHVATFRGNEGEASLVDLLRGAFSGPGTTLFTSCAMLALILHVSHGWWSLFQTLGLTAPGYDPLLRRGAKLLALISGGIYLLIPLLVLLNDRFPF